MAKPAPSPSCTVTSKARIVGAPETGAGPKSGLAASGPTTPPATAPGTIWIGATIAGASPAKRTAPDATNAMTENASVPSAMPSSRTRTRYSALLWPSRIVTVRIRLRSW